MGYPGRIRNITAMQRAGAEHFPFFVNRRFTTAELNAAVPPELLEAPASNLRYRVVDFSMIAGGAAVGGATDIRMHGFQGGQAVVIAAVPVAGLTQSTMVRPGTAAVTLLTDGRSFQPLDPGTGIRVGKTGGAITGAVQIDVQATVLLEGA
jgi:hypothetical protein